MRNEIETKRKETERNEIQRKETKHIETKRNEIKRTETKWNDFFPKRNVTNKNEKFNMVFDQYSIWQFKSDNVIGYLSIAFREKIMITVAKHVIILVIIRSLATPYAGPHKLFKIFLKLPRCIFTVTERKQPKAVIFFGEWNWKSCSAALQFRTPFERFFSFLSHVVLFWIPRQWSVYTPLKSKTQLIL